MVVTDEVALSLRFREPSPASPDVAAFVRTSASAKTLPAPARVGVLRGRRSLPSRAPLTLFFQPVTHGIPAITRGPAPMPDPGGWSIQPTAFGYLARVPRARSTSGRSRASWVMAACLPLAVPSVAAAALEAEAPVIQRPAGAEPAVPELPPGDPGVPTEPERAEPSERAEPVDTPEPVGTPEPVDTPEPEPVGSSAKPIRAPEDAADPFLGSERTDESGAGPLIGPAPDSGRADLTVLDAAWEGVDGYEVVLELKGGQSMTGRVGAVQRNTFTLIQAETGAVLVMPKSGVVSLRVRTPPALPSKNGIAALASGIVLSSVSTPVFISGLALLGICPSCAYLHLPMLLIGGGGLAGGIPLIVRGTRQRRAYTQALEERTVTPVAYRTRHGWTGGLRFRF